ncbi:LCP family protein [Nonomuraea ferruginea]
MSDYRGMSVEDSRSPQPGSRMARRLAASAPPPPKEPERGRRGGDGGNGKMRVLAWVSIAATSLMVAQLADRLRRLPRRVRRDRPEERQGRHHQPPPPRHRRAQRAAGRLRHPCGRRQRPVRPGDGPAGRRGRQAHRHDHRPAHLPPNRDQARLISFPRDSMVDIPKCKNETTKQEMPPSRAMINSAYNHGGVACTISTLETLTGIRINHFVEVDFSGFKNIADSLGGIEICLKSGVNDKNAKLVLPPGKSLLNGEKALGYVRLRSYGDGSDIQRIKRQQIFLSKVIAKATSSDLLTDPIKLTGFIKSAAQSVTMDPDLANNPQKLIDIGMSAKDLTAKGVKLTTVPWIPDPEDENRVVWQQPAAGELFDSIINDTELPEPTPSATADKPKVAVKPGQVRIQVLNATGEPGRAREVADQLAKEGFQVTGLGNYADAGGQPVAATEVRYPKTAETGADHADVLTKKLNPAPDATAKQGQAHQHRALHADGGPPPPRRPPTGRRVRCSSSSSAPTSRPSRSPSCRRPWRRTPSPRPSRRTSACKAPASCLCNPQAVRQDLRRPLGWFGSATRLALAGVAACRVPRPRAKLSDFPVSDTKYSPPVQVPGEESAGRRTQGPAGRSPAAAASSSALARSRPSPPRSPSPRPGRRSAGATRTSTTSSSCSSRSSWWATRWCRRSTPTPTGRSTSSSTPSTCRCSC